MRRTAQPNLSVTGQQGLTEYATYLTESEDLHPVTRRNYLSDLRQFMAWWETTAAVLQEAAPSFQPSVMVTPTLTRYRDYLQHECTLKPASVNRSLISLKRYCAWATETQRLGHNPATRVKLVKQSAAAPRHLTDAEEDALIAAVMTRGGVSVFWWSAQALKLRQSEKCSLARDGGEKSGRAKRLCDISEPLLV